jgi:DNA-binding Lrp family transcriptional regulator
MPADELDARILALLVEQPRTSVCEYAGILGIARGTLQARLDRLERDGVITGYAPSLSPAALGHPVLAFVHIEVTQGHLDDVGDALRPSRRSSRHSRSPAAETCSREWSPATTPTWRT